MLDRDLEPPCPEEESFERPEWDWVDYEIYLESLQH